MNWQKSKCSICKNEEAKRREIEPNKFIYECHTCGKFCASSETLEYKKDFIRDNWQKISSSLKKVTDSGRTVEIVLHGGLIKNSNQNTFDTLSQ